MQRASELGIVHRDIKPENILLTRKAEVKVTDFGLSRLTAEGTVPLNLTQSGVTLGTPLYMAPEQVQGKPTDHRSDLYSFGVTCYHLLAGQPPFRGNTAYDVAMKHVTETPEPLAAERPDLPGDLVALVHKLLAKDPAEALRHRERRDPRSGPDSERVFARPARAGGEPRRHDAAQLSRREHDAWRIGAVRPDHRAALANPPSRWPARLLGLLASLGLIAGGWWLFGRLQPKEETPVANGPGLPDLRFPESLVPRTTKERDLLAKLENRQTPSQEFVNASIELGLLYVKDHRFEKAKKIFDDLEKEKPDARGFVPRGLVGPPPYLLAARFGQAIVLAYQDKPDESVSAFSGAVQQQRNPMLGKFLLDHPDLSQAIAEALYRDQENLKPKKLPGNLDWLRNPVSLIGRK